MSIHKQRPRPEGEGTYRLCSEVVAPSDAGESFGFDIAPAAFDVHGLVHLTQAVMTRGLGAEADGLRVAGGRSDILPAESL